MAKSSTPPGFLTADQGRSWLCIPQAEALKEAGFGAFSTLPSQGSAEIVRRAEGRETRRVVLPDGSEAYLKQFPARPWPSRFCESSAGAVQEAMIQLALLELGLTVPQPLAWGVGPKGASFLLTAAIPGQDLRRHLASGWDSLVKHPGEQRDWIQELSNLVSRLHAWGYHHRDLYLNHFLSQADGRLALLDLQRARFSVSMKRRWRVKDLAALESSCPAAVSQADRLRFLLHYLKKSRLDDEARGWVKQVQRKALRYRRHVPKYPG